MKLRSLFLFLACLLMTLRAAPAHMPEESTTVARLQHGRLEVTVTMSPQMAGALAGLPADAETQEINESNFEDYRARLQEKAPDLLEVQDGDTLLLPTRTQLILNKLIEPTYLLFYRQPREWPLRLRVRFLSQLPAGYGGTAEVFDENETLLGRRILGREGPQAELSANPAPPPVESPTPLPPAAVSPNPPVTALPSPLPQPAQTPIPAPVPRVGIAWVAFALALTAILSLGLRRAKSSPPPR